jgi:hypothetical protein
MAPLRLSKAMNLVNFGLLSKLKRPRIKSREHIPFPMRTYTAITAATDACEPLNILSSMPSALEPSLQVPTNGFCGDEQQHNTNNSDATAQ